MGYYSYTQQKRGHTNSPSGSLQQGCHQTLQGRHLFQGNHLRPSHAYESHPPPPPTTNHLPGRTRGLRACQQPPTSHPGLSRHVAGNTPNSTPKDHYISLQATVPPPSRYLPLGCAPSTAPRGVSRPRRPRKNKIQCERAAGRLEHTQRPQSRRKYAAAARTRLLL